MKYSVNTHNLRLGKLRIKISVLRILHFVTGCVGLLVFIVTEECCSHA